MPKTGCRIATDVDYTPNSGFRCYANYVFRAISVYRIEFGNPRWVDYAGRVQHEIGIRAERPSHRVFITNVRNVNLGAHGPVARPG